MNEWITRNLSRRLFAVAGLAAAAALVGCGKKEEAPKAAAKAASAPAAPPPLKAAWVYIGPVGDAGWTFAHDQGRKAVEAEFGAKVQTTFVEKVPYADGERVIRDLAAQGNKIIFSTSFGYMDAMLKVAGEFPNVKFEHATGYKTAPNMRVYDARFYHDAYVSGIIAGGMTKTNTLGFVASFPIPEVLRNINAFTMGAQSVNPKIKTRVVWINSWFDPEKEGAAAQELINKGADVLLQNTDSTAVLQTAEKNGKFAFGWDSDMSSYAPKAHLASNIVDWGPYYKKSIKEVMDGTWKGEQRTIWGKPEGANDVIKIADFVPAELKAKAEAAKEGIKTGAIEVFTG
ncbi:MAG: hypothetical protein RLZZ451_2538, partial [Pseudomonadota bacterium]